MWKDGAFGTPRAGSIPRLLPNQRILALTFTNRAKANLSERLRRLLGVHQFSRYVTVHNFHGHAAEVILAHGRSLGIQLDGIGMPTTKTMQKALAQFSSDQATKDAAAVHLATAKRQALTDDGVIEVLDGAGNVLAKLVEAERVRSNQLHYEDLLRHAQRLLSVDEVANLYHQHYGAVLVDGFRTCRYSSSMSSFEVAPRPVRSPVIPYRASTRGRGRTRS